MSMVSSSKPTEQHLKNDSIAFLIPPILNVIPVRIGCLAPYKDNATASFCQKIIQHHASFSILRKKLWDTYIISKAPPRHRHQQTIRTWRDGYPKSITKDKTAKRFNLVIKHRYYKLTRAIPMDDTTTPIVASCFLNDWVFTSGIRYYMLTNISPQIIA